MMYYWGIMGVTVRNVPILPYVMESVNITLGVY